MTTSFDCRINDKKASKTHGIRNYPALSLFKMGEAIHYEGELLDSEGVLDFMFPQKSKVTETCTFQFCYQKSMMCLSLFLVLWSFDETVILGESNYGS